MGAHALVPFPLLIVNFCELYFHSELVSGKVEDLRNREVVAKCLKTAIGSKQYGYEDFFSKLIADVCGKCRECKAAYFMLFTIITVSCR